MAAKPKLELARFTGVVAKAAGTTADAEIEIARLVKRPQVRTKIGDLTQLASSIKAQGVIEPIIVHAEPDGSYLLIAGERRVEASKLAGLAKIPAIIKRGLSPREIRAIQVTENNEREDLTAYDQAMGVIQDVDEFGFREAMEIWNRTEAWVSKRIGVRKYADPILKLLQDESCGDLEVLHSLNQLYLKSEDEFKALANRLRHGQPVSREDARGRLNAVKEWEKQVRARDALKKVAVKVAAAPVRGNAEPPAPESGAGKKHKTAAAKAGATSSTHGDHGRAAAPPAASEAKGKRHDHAAQMIHGLREQLFDYGQNSKAHVGSLQNHMHELDYDLPDGEWVLWSGFMTVLLPMLEALGPDRATAYVRRVQSALKAKPPGEMWTELHPLRAGADAADGAAGREPVPAKPEGWRF